MGETPEPNEELKQLLQKHFMASVPSLPHSTTKSTSEIFSILDEHAPGKFVIGELYDVLIAAGFCDRLLGDDLVWDIAPLRPVRISAE